MVKRKRSARKTTSKRSKTARATRKKSLRGRTDISQNSLKRKTKAVFSNLLFFFVLFILSLVLYSVSGVDFYRDLFFLLSIVFGFISLAFLVSSLVLLFTRFSKR